MGDLTGTTWFGIVTRPGGDTFLTVVHFKHNGRVARRSHWQGKWLQQGLTDPLKWRQSGNSLECWEGGKSPVSYDSDLWEGQLIGGRIVGSAKMSHTAGFSFAFDPLNDDRQLPRGYRA